MAGMGCMLNVNWANVVYVHTVMPLHAQYIVALLLAFVIKHRSYVKGDMEISIRWCYLIFSLCLSNCNIIIVLPVIRVV